MADRNQYIRIATVIDAISAVQIGTAAQTERRLSLLCSGLEQSGESDVAKVVKCQQCRYAHKLANDTYVCDCMHRQTAEDFYCAFGEDLA